MSYTGKVTVTTNIGGVSFTGTASRTAESLESASVTLPAGKAGAISAAGVDGLATGHGILDTDTIDVHWSDPSDGTHKCRRGITVDTSAANAITFDDDPAASGDALPAEDTAVVVAVQVPIVMSFEGDQMEILSLKAGQRAIADFQDSGGSELAQKLVAGETYSWISGQGVTNPLASDSIVLVNATNGSITETTLYIALLLNTVA